MGLPHSTTAGNRADAVIIGGGLHGCSAALHLALRGMSVIVLEKDYVGRHASGVNAGGVRRLGRAFSEIPLAVASAKIWHEIESLVENDCGFVSTCQIKVAETKAELNQLEARAAQVSQLGFSHEKIIDKEALRELLPAISPHCIGGMIVEGDGYANPFRTTQAFRQKCENIGVLFRQGAYVGKIRRTGGTWRVHTSHCIVEAPNLVNCAGAWGGRIAAMLGEPVPIEAHAPMLMISARMPPFVTPVVGAQGRTLSFKQFTNGTVLVGGGHEGRANLKTNGTHLDYAGLATSAQTATTLFPIMHKARIVRCWAGIEGVMPDGIPVISPSQSEGAFHAFGFSAHGFQLGPIGGKILSDLIIAGETDLPIAPFRINRFVKT
jgi:sarcosine oxidase subunit beta